MKGDGNGNKTKTLAFVTVGGERKVLVFSADGVAFGSPPPKLLKAIELPPGDDEPHAAWPSGDGTRVWVGLQIGNAAVALDARTLEVVGGSRVEIGAQSPMGMIYVPGAAAARAGAKAPEAGAATTTKAATAKGALLSPEKAREQSRALHFELVAPTNDKNKNKNENGNNTVLTSLVINQQSTFVDALEAVVAGLKPGESYALCLTKEKKKEAANDKSPSCDTVVFEFKGGRDGAANVATVGPFTDLLFEKEKNGTRAQKRFFVVAPKEEKKGNGGFGGAAVQVQQQ